MDGSPRRRLARALQRVRRVERRELADLRAWLESTATVVRLSALVVLPVVLAAVTWLANHVGALSYVLFPPLAAGAFTLFRDPHGRFASPTRFVVGLVVGALCGWVALVAASTLGRPGTATPSQVSAVGAALAVFLAGAATWALDVEAPAAFSTALLGLLVPAGRQPAFVASVAVGSAVVAGVFAAWRGRVYEQRASILYRSASADDHVLVPMTGEAERTVALAAQLAAAHEAGKVVLLDLLADPALARAERELLAEHGAVQVTTVDEPGEGPRADHAAVEAAVARLEDRARTVEADHDLPCEVVVASEGRDRAGTVARVASATDCDLVAVPYEQRYGSLARWIQGLFRTDLDVLVHRSVGEGHQWDEAMVPVRRTGQVAHNMVDFARRLVGDGTVSVCHCVGSGGAVRGAETMLADLVEPFGGAVETRVSRESIHDFLGGHAGEYDIVFVGASRDRSTASRLFSPPTFHQLEDLETDLAIVDRG